jgi:hypothetical protein
MHSGELVFAQLMDHLPLHTFRCYAAKYPVCYPAPTFSHLDQFLVLFPWAKLRQAKGAAKLLDLRGSTPAPFTS